MSTPLPPEVVNALSRGNLVEAIKLLRKTHPHMGLAEAKALLDAVANLAPKPPPHAPAGKASHAGGLQASHASAPKHDVVHIPRRPGLSPGEVPRSSSAAGGMALLVVAVLAVLLYVRFG